MASALSCIYREATQIEKSRTGSHIPTNSEVQLFDYQEKVLPRMYVPEYYPQLAGRNTASKSGRKASGLG